MHFTCFSKTHTLFKKLFYTEALGKFFSFTSIPSFRNLALEKKLPLAKGSLGTSRPNSRCGQRTTYGWPGLDSLARTGRGSCRLGGGGGRGCTREGARSAFIGKVWGAGGPTSWISLPRPFTSRGTEQSGG
jgi:hypothetical protein